jgi:hypothetical protein
MLQLQGSHIIYAFSDPAGANACMAMAKLGALFQRQSSTLFSNRKYNTTFGEDFEFVEEVPDFKKYKGDCLFTGTSHPESSNYFEVDSLQQAKESGLKTISFVDHWVNFRLRFLDKYNNPNYPDEVWVVDERAKELALEEGIPEYKLVVSGNPYHEFLKFFWKPVYEGKSYLEFLGISASDFIVLFAPDPLSIRDGKEIAGFTEDQALEQLLDVTGQLNIPIQVIVKCHPLQPFEIFSNILKKYGSNVHLLSKADTLELLNASDVVIGFFSNILLEAEALGKKVIRYFPGNESADLLKHKASLPVVFKEHDLLKTLKHSIHE